MCEKLHVLEFGAPVQQIHIESIALDAFVDVQLHVMIISDWPFHTRPVETWIKISICFVLRRIQEENVTNV